MHPWKTVLLLCCLVAGRAWGQDLPPSGLRVGAQIPPLSGVDLGGNPVDLSAHLGRSTVVLSFWSIHCLDCIRELDDLRAIRRDFPAEDVTIVALNTDSGLPVARIASFVRRYEASRGDLEVVHLLDRDAAIVDGLGVNYIPVLGVVDRAGRVTSVLTGYEPEDRARVAQAMEEGRVALGAWSEGLRGRLRTVLRSTGPGGERIEWGSFRVEQGMPLFGTHDADQWLFDAAGSRDREREARRVEAVVADRLLQSLLQESLASIGVRLPGPRSRPFHPGGVTVPEGPLQEGNRWRSLYDALRFGEMFREESRAGVWVADEYWAGLVGDVDLGALRRRLEAIDFPLAPVRIHLQTVSDFDFKPRALLQQVLERSYRVQSVQGEHLTFFGRGEQLAQELRQFAGPFQVFVDVEAPDALRVEVF